MAMTKSQRRRITTIVRYVVLSVWALIAFFPIYWIISTSFKPDTQWFAWPPYYFPSPPTLANYMNVWFGAEEYAADAIRHLVAEAADFTATTRRSSRSPRRSSRCCSAR